MSASQQTVGGEVSLTRNERLDRLPFNKAHRKLLVASGIGWAFDAMDVGLVSFVVAAIAADPHFNLTPTEKSWVLSIGFVGMAIGAGTDIAIDAADVVLMKSRLSDVPAAIRLSRATLRNIHENLFWAFFYNIIGIPLAAGVWIPLFGWQLNPMFGAAAMSLSSFCVVTNALRLNLFRMYDAGKDRRIKNAVTGQTAAAAVKEPDDALEKKSETNQKKENETMKKTMKINGMMCGHCEARVKKALEAVEGVQEAVVSHEAGNAVVTLSSDVADEVLKKAVEDQDYEVVSVES